MKITTGEAVKALTEALKNDHELFFSYQSNIAMAFVNEFKETSSLDINEIANEAAINFLNMWIKTGSA